MPKFYFHYQGSSPLRDETGELLPDEKAAIRSARDIAAEIRGTMNGSIVVEDDAGAIIAEVFIDSMQTEASGRSHRGSAGAN